MTSCPRCGAPLASPGASCPRCLLELGALEDPNAATAELPPQERGVDLGTIGPYRLLSVLGEGGMGTVYLAEQREPIERRVALKLVKAGLGGKEVLARFEAERQALALMTHPGIARVLDAGATSDGSPYFVMEYVQGEPITAYCDRKRLATAERIELFREVCAAVQHAHQRGILHRDLKPSNLLVEEVDGKARPRVIDFGLAKALNQRLTERTLFTERGAIVGTPEYMSPEQAAGEAYDVDTTTDVYSLGAVLYELLTGSLPHDPQKLREAGWLGMMKLLREEEAKKPSTKVSTFNEETASAVAGRRQTEPKALLRSLRGDLDWILMKSLDRERERRYANVSDLAADLERHLSNQPVAAGPPSATYRARKFVARHRGAAASAAAIGLLVVVAVGSLWKQGAIERRQRREAQALLDSERIVSRFRVELMRSYASRSDPAVARTSREEEVKRAVESLERRLAGREAETQATALVAAAETLVDFDAEVVAFRLLRRALELREGSTTTPPLALASNYHVLALTNSETRATELLPRALEIYRRELGDEHPATIDVFCDGVGASSLDVVLGRGSEVVLEQKRRRLEVDARRCVDLTERFESGSERQLARRLSNLSFALNVGDRKDLARQFAERAAELLRGEGPEASWQLAEALERLAMLSGYAGDAARMDTLYREACALREQAAGSATREAAICRLNHGGMLIQDGRSEEGVELRRSALGVLTRLAPEFGWRERFPETEEGVFVEVTSLNPLREDLRRAFDRARSESGGGSEAAEAKPPARGSSLPER